MKKICLLFFVLAMSISLLIACTSSDQPEKMVSEVKKEAVKTATSAGQVKEPAGETVSAGEGLFRQNCAMCHPDGGNIINPQKTLHKDVREQNGIKTEEDIIKKMRNPAPGMSTFNETDLPDKDAKGIAEYILNTF